MAKQDYIPKKNGEKATWAATLKATIATDGPTIGLTLAQITAVQDACDDIMEGVDEIDAAITAKESAVDAATTKIINAEKVIRPEIKLGKANSAYTNAIGQHMGVVGDEQTIDVPNSRPILKLKKAINGIQIDFNLQGFFDGVNIYKLNGGNWVYIAHDTSSPYIDTHPANGDNRYHVCYVLGDAEVGIMSADESFAY